MSDLDSVYHAMGGEQGVRRLVASFYARVGDDPVLRPLYPEEDLSGARERLTLFLLQRLGGPRTYSEQRGHPRLRMRHAPFAIGTPQAEAWLANMRAALDELALAPETDAALWDYLFRSAAMLRNVDDPAVRPP